MLKNSLIIAWRSLIKNKSYSIINSLGLTVGITAFLLISLYVRYEFGYDRYLENKENIYRIQMNRYDNGVLSTQWAAGCAGIGPALISDFPEVVAYAKLYRENGIVQYEEKAFKEERSYYATSDFFKVFSINLIKGNDSLVLKDPFSVVISKSKSQKYFGDEDPIGKTIKLNGHLEFTVSGVFDDIPEQSHMEADILYSFESFVDQSDERARTAWNWSGFYTYITLRPGTDPREFESKLPEFVQQKWGEEMSQYNAGMEFLLQPVTDIHLNSDLRYEFKANGDGKTTRFLLIISIFIIFIAWVNFINLTMAKSMDRAREVGIRKVMGSTSQQLTYHFILESFILNFIGLVISLLLFNILLPYFNQVSGVSLSISFTDKFLWYVIPGIFVLGGFFPGIYPALVLSSFKPAHVLKGRLSSRASGLNLRKVLVVFQFMASLILMVGTMTIFEQLRYIRNQELGFDIKQMMIINGPIVKDSLYASKFNSFKHELLGFSSVSSVASSTSVPGNQPGWNAGGIRLIEQPDTEAKQYRIIAVDGDFIDSYELEVVAGRNFNKELSNERASVLFNESAAELLGFSPDEILNRNIFFWGDTFNIVGVLKDYHQESPKKSFEPIIFRYDPAVTKYYSIKVNNVRLPETIKQIEDEWHASFPGNPFDYFFLDDHFNIQYKAEIRFGIVFGLFAGLAIFIACLGLYGLASYVTKYRIKEIGIRKVLGASISNVWLILSRDFTTLVMVAILISIPLSWYAMKLWLQEFAERIDIKLWLFALPALLLMFIALFSVSFQTIKSALSNPVDTLRDE